MRNDYEIRGDVTVIFLDRKDGSRLECLIDTDDLPRAMEFQWKWSPHWDRHTCSFYAEGKSYYKRVNGKDLPREYFGLHRWIMMPSSDEEVDHIFHDTLDNRRGNLRILPRGANQQNYKGARKDGSSGVRGVRKFRDKWKAAVKVSGVEHRFGYFDNVHDAELAVVEARAKLMPYSIEALNSK